MVRAFSIHCAFKQPTCSQRDVGAGANTPALTRASRMACHLRASWHFRAGPRNGPSLFGASLRIIFRDPLPLNTIGEGSSFSLGLTFWDDSAEPWTASTPTTISYRVDCTTTGASMRTWTTLTPAAATTISLASADNAINDQSRRQEGRQVTVKTDSGLSTQAQDTFTYAVSNNGAV